MKKEKRKKRRANGIIFCETMGEECNQILNLQFLHTILILSLKIWLNVKITFLLLFLYKIEFIL